MVFLVIFNIGIFYFSLTLTDKIAQYEKKIDEIHHENINLEKQLSDFQSLEFASKISKSLGFVSQSQLIFLNQINYAFLPNQ